MILSQLTYLANTPTEGINSSPAQRFYSRRKRTLLPTKSSLFHPKVVQNVKSQKKKHKDKQNGYFDLTTKNLPELKRGDTVRIKPFGSHKTWKRGQGQSKDNTPTLLQNQNRWANI